MKRAIITSLILIALLPAFIPKHACASFCVELLLKRISFVVNPPFNPSGRVDNCVACVSAFLKTIKDKGMLHIADRIESEYGYTGRERRFSLATALSYVKGVLNRELSSKPVPFMDPDAPSGYYVVFCGRKPYNLKHVIIGRVFPDGTRVLYDPQVHMWFSWKRMVRMYGGGFPYLVKDL